MPSALKRLLIGRPLKTAQLAEERLDKKIALAVFSSDALSSVAYATEEILYVLVLAGTAAFSFALPVAAAIVVLLIFVVISFGQTIRAYPSGGGAYIVAKDNLGNIPGLVAGAALLVDYTLTVAVSISAGIAAITSAFPHLYPDRVLLAVAAIALIAVANLRGVRASGSILAAPAYIFICSLAAVIGVGIYKLVTHSLEPALPAAPLAASEAITVFLVLRAFAAGCTALTGVEAISNGVQAFKKPEAHNARVTLYAMGAILGSLFIGVTVLARHLQIVPVAGETVVSQIARAIFDHGFFYYLVQAATAIILILAANTSFAGFPRLASFMARDRYLPVQLINQGDRLVYSNGIILLASFSALLVIGFSGDTHRLMPLYAIGVFLGFTLSQFGMVKKWLTDKEPAWLANVLISAIGGTATALVLLVITVSKFDHGAWVILLILPLLVGMSLAIKKHYDNLRTKLTLSQELEVPVPTERVVILFVGDIHKGTVAAARYAKSLHPHLIKAIHVSFDEQDAADIREKWDRWGMDIPLIITPSPYRRVTDNLLHYIREIEHQRPQAAITVILPEYICPHWWQLLLHNQTAAWIKHELLREHVAVVSVPIQLV